MGQTAFEIQAETCMSYLPFPEGIRYFCMPYCIVFFRHEFLHALLQCIFRCEFLHALLHLETIKTPRNNKSTWPAASCFHLFLGVWNNWWNTRTRFWFLTYYIINSLYVRVHFLRARVTLGLNSPSMRIKREKQHGVFSWKIACFCLLILFVFYWVSFAIAF